jgi:hypothetical protein
MLDRCALPEDEFLELYRIPGALISDDKRKKILRYVLASKSGRLAMNVATLNEKAVTKVENLFGTQTIIWTVEDLEDGIGVAMGWSGGVDLLNAFQTFASISKCVSGACLTILYIKRLVSRLKEIASWGSALLEKSMANSTQLG